MSSAFLSWCNAMLFSCRAREYGGGPVGRQVAGMPDRMAGMRRAGLTAFAVLSGVLTAGPLAAQDADVDMRARQLFEEGRGLFAEQRYEDALDRFRRSYDLSHRPALLYNIGLAADRARLDQ